MSSFNYGFSPSVFLWKKEGSTEQTTDDGDTLTGEVESIVDTTTDAVTGTFLMYKFDGVPSEGHTSQAIVTKFPMSSGFIVSDHMIKQNRILKIKVVASNMVNNELWDLTYAGAAVAVGDILSAPLIGLIGDTGALVQASFETADRVATAFHLFNSFMANGTRLYVNTILGQYLNCVVTDIETVQDKESSAIMAAEITLEELQVVTEDGTMSSARSVMTNMTDYSKFVKMAQGVGINALSKIL